MLRLIVRDKRVALQQSTSRPDRPWDLIYVRTCKTLPEGVYQLSDAEKPRVGATYRGQLLAFHDGWAYQLTETRKLFRHPVASVAKASIGDVVSVSH